MHYQPDQACKQTACHWSDWRPSWEAHSSQNTENLLIIFLLSPCRTEVYLKHYAILWLLINVTDLRLVYILPVSCNVVSGVSSTTCSVCLHKQRQRHGCTKELINFKTCQTHDERTLKHSKVIFVTCSLGYNLINRPMQTNRCADSVLTTTYIYYRKIVQLIHHHYCVYFRQLDP